MERGVRPRGPIPVVEVVDVVVVEVDGLLDQAKTQGSCVEVEVVLGVGDSRGDVMETPNMNALLHRRPLAAQSERHSERGERNEPRSAP